MQMQGHKRRVWKGGETSPEKSMSYCWPWPWLQGSSSPDDTQAEERECPLRQQGAASGAPWAAPPCGSWHLGSLTLSSCWAVPPAPEKIWRDESSDQRFSAGFFIYASSLVPEVRVLVLAGIELNFFVVAGTGLCFGLVMRTVLIIQGCLLYC